MRQRLNIIMEVLMGPAGNTEWKSQTYSGRKMKELQHFDRKLRLDFELRMVSWK